MSVSILLLMSLILSVTFGSFRRAKVDSLFRSCPSGGHPATQMMSRSLLVTGGPPRASSERIFLSATWTISSFIRVILPAVFFENHWPENFSMMRVAWRRCHQSLVEVDVLIRFTKPAVTAYIVGVCD
jgi:hypothetical protein